MTTTKRAQHSRPLVEATLVAARSPASAIDERFLLDFGRPQLPQALATLVAS